MPIPVLDSPEYLKRLLTAPRPGADNVLAFYEHRIGAIGTDPRYMLLPLDDHLVHRGDGVFETIKYLNSRIYQLDAHLKRMQRSANAIHLAPPCPWEMMREIILDVAHAGGRNHGLLRVLLGRGPGGFGIDPTECPVPSLFVIAYKFHPKFETVFDKGVNACRSSIPAKQNFMACIKSTNYLPNVLMKQEAFKKGYDFTLCFDEHGFLAESATENCCIVDATGTIIVPELTNALTGTTLIRALNLIKNETPILFRGIVEEEIYEAQELILIGTAIDAISVVCFNGKPIHDMRPGPVSQRLRALLQQDLEREGTPLTPSRLKTTIF
ncbi:Branched-chain amino acid aminotransferase/4-amino-4-deoxychorismate lyase [Desulfovibrionales bacterium]